MCLIYTFFVFNISYLNRQFTFAMHFCVSFSLHLRHKHNFIDKHIFRIHYYFCSNVLFKCWSVHTHLFLTFITRLHSPLPFPILPSPWWTALSTALTPDPVSMSHVQFPWSRNNVYLLVGCHFRFLVFLCDGPEGSLPLQLLENSQHNDLILSLQKNDNLILRLQRNATKR